MRVSPSPSDIRLKLLRLLDDAGWLPDASLIALLHAVRYVSCRQVWTYSPPSDPVFPADDVLAARILRIKGRRWAKVKKDVLSFFDKCEGGYRLKPHLDWIEIVGGYDRPAMPPSLRISIGRRDNWTCGYCGSTDGPFDIDHIVPLSRGGSNVDPDNLICACAPCNRSKGSKLVSEWVS